MFMKSSIEKSFLDSAECIKKSVNLSEVIEKAIKEIERVGKKKYIMLESYRNDKELFNLQCWALTCNSFFSKEEWMWLYKKFGFSGDYEFIYFN